MDETEHPPTTTTIPSSPAATPSSTDAPPPSLPAQTSSLTKLRLLILRYLTYLLRKTDRTILRVSTLLSSPTTTDNLLCTTSYTLSLLHALVSRLLSRRLTALATDLAQKATPVLLPGETLIATLQADASTRLLAQTTASVKALAGVIGDYRIFVRLWGMVGIYTWARGTWNSPLAASAGQREKVLRRLAWGSIASCVGFQVLENGAYLASKGVLTSASWSGEAGKIKEGRWWIWSSRFWAAYVALELARLGVERYCEDAALTAGEKSVLGDGEKEGKLLKEKKEAEERIWWRDLASNLAYMPMTLHWSVEEERGILNEWGVGALGVIAGGANLVHAWRCTA